MQRHLLLAQAGGGQATGVSATGVSAPSEKKLLKSSLTICIPATHSFISNDTLIKWTGMPNSYLLRLFLSANLWRVLWSYILTSKMVWSFWAEKQVSSCKRAPTEVKLLNSLWGSAPSAIILHPRWKLTLITQGLKILLQEQSVIYWQILGMRSKEDINRISIFYTRLHSTIKSSCESSRRSSAL